MTLTDEDTATETFFAGLVRNKKGVYTYVNRHPRQNP